MLIALAVLAHAGRAEPDVGRRAVDELGVAIGIAAAFALLLAWLHPWLMLVVVTGLVAVYWALDYTGGPALLTGPLSVLLFGLMRPRRELYPAAGGVVVVLAGALAVGPSLRLGEITALLALNAAAAFGADAARQRTERRRAEAEIARRRQEQGVAELQLALARDLHDTVAHALTGITVQATLISRLAPTDPTAATRAAQAIADASRSALGELNQMVRSLREPGPAAYAPSLGLDDVPALISQAERAGLRIRLRRGRGGSQPSPGRQLAAYRLVQEGLTNATRYAPGSTVVVSLLTDPVLVVRVTDSGGAAHAAPVPGAGHGLLGLAERVEATGGQLRYGPRPDGGFEVEATWPS